MQGRTMASFPSLVILLAIATRVHLQTPAATTANHRLPPNLKPFLYTIELTVPATAFTPTDDRFQGVVDIEFSVENSATEIVLHANRQYLDILSVFFKESSADTSSDDVTAATAYDSVTDFMTIADQELRAGINYTLTITFNGTLSTTEMAGFYKSSYREESTDTTKYLATTQFQPTSARRAFPCFDEPAFKAEFIIKMKFPTGMNILANMEETNRVTIEDGDLQLVEFEKTPTMSTYLIAFVISEFDCSAEATKIGNVDHRICSRIEATATRKWAEEIGPKILASLNEYTQIPYNLSMNKLDQVAIPDFSAGAMENWGLVTYREAYLLWDPVESSNRYKQYVATTIAHELAHQWFGNLVTTKWWSELFLNEGFANFFEYFTTHDVFPEWELDKQYVIEVVQSALRFDVLEGIAALQSDVSSASEASAKFNTISYHKGGSVFRMIEHVMGSTNFRSGLQKYLKANEFSNTVPEILWEHLNNEINASYSNLPASLERVVDSWIKKSGFPLIKATLNGSTVSLTQSRFLLSGIDEATSDWYVPVTFTLSSDEDKFASTSPRLWLEGAPAEITLPDGDDAWVLLNNHATGFYRVNYDGELRQRIGRLLKSVDFGGIPEVNRAQIVDDLFNLARTNRVRYSEVFEMIQFLADDLSYFSWTPAFYGFSFLLERVGRESELGRAISNHLLSLMTNLYASTPIAVLNENDQIYTLKQALTQSMACALDHPLCIAEANVLYSAYRITRIRPNKNLRDTIYCSALRHSSDSSDWDFLWGEYSKATIANEQTTILNSLGCSTNATLLERYLHMTLNETSGIRSQDRDSVFKSVVGKSTIGIDVAARFLMDNYEQIIEKYQSLNSFTGLLLSLANKFTTQEEIDTLKNFMERANLSSEYSTVANSVVATAEANLRWMERFETDLRNHYGISTTDSTPPNGGTSLSVSQNDIVVLMVTITLSLAGYSFN
uniref:Aminopeptidase n=1 Tax=Gastrophysa viridula TaxID=154015 RepID=D9J2F3_GASVI|nr:aminopeptidase N [Gastrophysa viridula]